MRIMLVDNEGRVELRASLDECRTGSFRLLWIDLDGPTSQEIARVREHFDLHPVVFSQMGAAIPVPKMQEFEDYLYVVWDFVRDKAETELLEVEGLYLVLGGDYLITAHHDGLEELDEMQERLKSSPTRYAHPAALLYGILEQAVDDYFPMMASLSDRIDEYTEALISDRNVGDLSIILGLKHRNMAYRRAAYAHRDVIIKLSRRDIALIPDEWDAFLIDIYDRMAKVVAEVEYNAEQIASALDIHMSAVSNRLNKTMKRLTAVATFFMPATFLVGLYGMNFNSMPEVTWRFGYLFFWGVLVVVTVVMIWIGRREDWF